MAGHSQWANRKHRKQRQDAKKGKIFSKMAKRITVAAREGGGDPETNATLRMYIEKAKSFDVPNENIERAIKRGTGELEGVEYKEATYEGYGPGGVAVLVTVVTDNRNRTVSEIRHLFDKNGGSLGEAGCVAWMFERKGFFVIDRGRFAFDEEEMLLIALEAGAENLETDEEQFSIYTAPEDFHDVKEALESEDLEFKIAELTMVPNNEVPVSGSDAKRLLNLIEALEDHDDVEEVYGNFDLADELITY